MEPAFPAVSFTVANVFFVLSESIHFITQLKKHFKLIIAFFAVAVNNNVREHIVLPYVFFIFYHCCFEFNHCLATA